MSFMLELQVWLQTSTKWAVSWNRGPKSTISPGLSIQNHPALGVPPVTMAPNATDISSDPVESPTPWTWWRGPQAVLPPGFLCCWGIGTNEPWIFFQKLDLTHLTWNENVNVMMISWYFFWNMDVDMDFMRIWSNGGWTDVEVGLLISKSEMTYCRIAPK